MIIGLERLLGWERLPLFGCFGYVEIIKCLMVKKISLACYLPVYRYASLMITSSAGGEPRHVYGCLYTIEDNEERYFFPIWVAA
jgi:hypothetical protein